VHGADQPPGDVGVKDEASEASAAPADPLDETMLPGDLLNRPMREACKALGIKLTDVMAFKVYDDKVVVIEGPTGWKRVWHRK